MCWTGVPLFVPLLLNILTVSLKSEKFYFASYSAFFSRKRQIPLQVSSAQPKAKRMGTCAVTGLSHFILWNLLTCWVHFEKTTLSFNVVFLKDYSWDSSRSVVTRRAWTLRPWEEVDVFVSLVLCSSHEIFWPLLCNLISLGFYYLRRCGDPFLRFFVALL